MCFYLGYWGWGQRTGWSVRAVVLNQPGVLRNVTLLSWRGEMGYKGVHSQEGKTEAVGAGDERVQGWIGEPGPYSIPFIYC